MSMLLIGLVLCAAAAYQVVALIACLFHLLRREQASFSFPGVSILKPIYGADDEFYRAIRSHAMLDYPRFEILFGIRNLEDTAIPHIERLQKEFPNIPIGITRCHTTTANGKVGALIDLSREARYEVRVVNDSDIRVEPDYLKRIVPPLADTRIGLVTCLYRATARSFPTTLEALGIATDFAPSTLVARLFGVNDFGLGSTLCFRAADLERIGGFETIADYIADDYLLGKRLSQAGHRIHLSRFVVETHLGSTSWREVWNHQVRWARTIRVSGGPGYYGLPLTNATLAAGLGVWLGWWQAAAGLLILRAAVGLSSGVAILRDPLTARWWWLMPVRDLLGLAVWIAGLAGSEVVWRGRKFRLSSRGKLVSVK